MKVLEVEIVEPKIITNFDDFKSSVTEYTKKFEIEVTSENIKEAKASSASLNKLKSDIKSEAKKYLNTLEAPIKEFKEKLKEIDNILDGKRYLITSAVSVFEDAKKLEHLQKMQDYLNEKLLEVELRKEFRSFYLPSPSVAGLTSKGDLSKKFKESIDVMIIDAVERQKLQDIEIENQRLKDEARANEILREREIQERNKAVEEPEHGLRPIGQPDYVKESEPIYEPIIEHKNEKSIYEIHLIYKVRSNSNVGCEDMLKKVLPMIDDKKIPLDYTTCKEL